MKCQDGIDLVQHPVPVARTTRVLRQVPERRDLERPLAELSSELDALALEVNRETRIVEGNFEGQVQACIRHDVRAVDLLGQLSGTAVQRPRLPHATLVAESDPLGDQAIGRDVGRADSFGSRQNAVDQLESLGVLAEPDEVARQGGGESDRDRVVGDRRKTLHGGTEEGNRLIMLATLVQRSRSEADHPRHGALVAKPLADLLRPLEEWERLFRPGTDRGGFASLLQHLSAIRFAVGDLDRLLEILHGLEGRPEGDGPIGGGPKSDPRLARERLGFGTFGRRPERRQVVGCQCAGELVVAERLEVARRGQVPAAAVAQREGRVGDLADDGLDERVLAPFR